MTCRFKEYIPVVHEYSFVHRNAVVTGNVLIGKNCHIGSGAALRGDAQPPRSCVFTDRKELKFQSPD
jgi:carbonic anhydrase/acetyltransferase-like protein (isoleucine patch superfamily)